MKKKDLETILGPAFSVKEAQQIVSQDEIRRLYLHRPFWGVRMATDATPLQVLAALMVQLPQKTFAARDTAAALHGLPTSYPDDARGSLSYPCIGVQSSSTRVRRTGVRGCRLSVDFDRDVEVVSDVRTTSVARTWLDLSAYLDSVYLQMYTDLALSRGLVSLDELSHQMVSGRHRSGKTARETAFKYAQPQIQSAQESIFRSHLRCAGLPSPEPGRDFFLSEGTGKATWRLLGIYKSQKIAGYFSTGAFDATQAALRNLGFHVISVTTLDLLKPTVFIERFRKELTNHCLGIRSVP